ncbi:hypothetical protein V501_00532 [Pseudogymnoascus sp. VKM F-4519 (FW-2642)]|nr:hypothetical protein V501_00532 [Pseudogymnoascus sp. VKM F-4519 (FW-2642)]
MPLQLKDMAIRAGARRGRCQLTTPRLATSKKVTGFGASLAKTTVEVFNKLPPLKLAKLLEELVTPLGNDFDIMRHTIGSSDLSPEPAMSYVENKFTHPVYVSLTTKSGEMWSGKVEAQSVTTWVLPPNLLTL